MYYVYHKRPKPTAYFIYAFTAFISIQSNIQYKISSLDDQGGYIIYLRVFSHQSIIRWIYLERSLTKSLMQRELA